MTTSYESDQDVATCLGGDFWEYVETRPCIPAEKKPAVDLFKRQNHEEVTIRQLTAFLLYSEWNGDSTTGSHGVQCSEGELVVTSQRLLFFNDGPKHPVPLACMPLAVVDRVIKLQHTHFISSKAGQLKLLQIQGKDLRTVVFGFSRSNHGARGVALDSILHSLNLLQAIWSPHPQQLCTLSDHSVIDDEYQRLLRLGNAGLWRISKANRNYGLCHTYPSKLILPVSVSDEDVVQAATFRARGRLPTFCWQHPHNGAVLSRSGQPKVGFMQSSRSDTDEALVAALGAPRTKGERRKLVIADARPRKNALANGAMGGGSEPRGHYLCSEVVYLGIDNIHAVRESAHKLREYLEQFGGPSVCLGQRRNGGNWGVGGSWGLSTSAAAEALVSTSWLQHVHKLLCGAAFVATQVCVEGSSVLVHCSDGWDRTPALLCCALVMMDPHYRTRAGFKAMVELHWASFGHQFAERMGSVSPEGSATPSAGSNNQSPIFLQWIDCIAQLLCVYPRAFQFSTAFLVTFLDLVLSCRFHNFVCNSEAEREECGVRLRLPCIWDHLSSLDEGERGNGGAFHNPLYCPSLHPHALLPSAAALSPLLVPALYLRWNCPKGGVDCGRGHKAGCCRAMEDAVRDKVDRLTQLDRELAELKKRSEVLSSTLEFVRQEGDRAREREQQALQENSVLRQQLATVGVIPSVNKCHSASEHMVSLSITDRGSGRMCSDRLCKGCDSDGFSVDFNALRQPVKEAHFVAAPAHNRSLSVSS